jgi:hypothetical protein
MAAAVHAINQKYAGVAEYIEYRATYDSVVNLSELSKTLAARGVDSTLASGELAFDFGPEDDNTLVRYARCYIVHLGNGTTVVNLRLYGIDEPRRAFHINTLDRHRPELQDSMAYIVDAIFDSGAMPPSEYSWSYGYGEALPFRPHAGL